jgi:uncharacterized membrane protein
MCAHNLKYKLVISLGITNKRINSYQLIISLFCSYMFQKLCVILRELVGSFLSYMPMWVLVDNIPCGMCLYVYYVAVWCVSIDTHQTAATT